MPRLFTLLSLLLVLQLRVQAQGKYLFSSLSSRNGLVSEETSAVQQDDKGFIWIATMDGLQRFDGRRFLTFRYAAGDSTSLPNDNLKTIRIDRKNRLWLVCNENRVGYFDVLNFRFHEVSCLISKDSLRMAETRLRIDGDDNILLIVKGSGIFRYDEDKNKFTSGNLPFRYPKEWKPISLAHDKAKGQYWIACDSGLVKYNSIKKSLSYRHHNTDMDSVIANLGSIQFLSAVLPDNKGRFWLVSGTALNPGVFLTSYNTNTNELKKWEVFDLDKNIYQEIYYISQQDDGTVWLLGSNLLAQLNEKEKRFDWIESNLPGQFSIRYEATRHIYEDREKNIWISTNRGVFRVNPLGQVFRRVTNSRPGSKDGLFTQAVSGFVQTREGEILVSTQGDALFRYDKNLQPLPPNHFCQLDKENEYFISCLLEQSNGDIWKGHPYGFVSVEHADTHQRDNFRDLAAFGRSLIIQIVEDKDGNIWVGTEDGRLSKRKGNGSFMLMQNFGNRIRRLLVDQQGFLWACTEQTGLYKINASSGQILTHYTADDPGDKRLLSNFCSDIIQYSDSLFIIASGGLNFLNRHTNKISHMLQPDELPSNTVSNIVKDKLGYLWVTTQGGICSVNMNNYVVTNYNERDGVHINIFSDAASLMLTDGRIMIGTPHDWMVFDPVEVNKRNPKVPPNVTIARFGQMNKWLNMDSLSRLPFIELPYDQNSITIEFTTLTYQTSYGIFYKLEELDKDWQLSRLGNQAVYNYLPPGDYIFKAMCKSTDGIQSTHIVELKIRIKPPFWKTWWFLGILVFAGIFILFWLDKLRMQKLRATESIRTRIATSLTEDMSNSLSNINISSELAKTKIDTDTQRTKEYIGQISETSNRMVQAMYDMVWSINPLNDTMADTIDRMKAFAGEIENIYALNVDFDIEKQVMRLKLDMENRYELLSIFKEVVTNAGKHAGGRYVKVNIRYKKQKLLMMIVDDGKGFNMDNVSMMGRGISDMRRRAAAINASFYIESEINTGTIVKLEIPV